MPEKEKKAFVSIHGILPVLHSATTSSTKSKCFKDEKITTELATIYVDYL